MATSRREENELLIIKERMQAEEQRTCMNTARREATKKAAAKRKLWRDQKIQRLSVGARQATRQMKLRVESSPTLLHFSKTCHNKICLQCVPWWCISKKLNEEDERGGLGGRGGRRRLLGIMVYSRSIISVGWIHFIVSILYLLIVMLIMLTTTYNRRLYVVFFYVLFCILPYKYFYN